MTFISYPRTKHIKGSNFQVGDHDMKSVSINELFGKNLVVEEKIDGANAGISFENGRLMLQSRGHYLVGGPREKHFNLLKQWTSIVSNDLFSILGDRYVMFGEWMAAKHTCFYDNLPHYFMEFDLYDKNIKQFLSSDARKDYYEATAPGIIESVKIVSSGEFERITDFSDLITESNFITSNRDTTLIASAAAVGVDELTVKSHTDLSRNMEGLYVKWEDNGIVKGRYKFVRSTFTNKILEQDQHWLDRPIIKNGLSALGRKRMFLEK